MPVGHFTQGHMESDPCQLCRQKKIPKEMYSGPAIVILLITHFASAMPTVGFSHMKFEN